MIVIIMTAHSKKILGSLQYPNTQLKIKSIKQDMEAGTKNNSNNKSMAGTPQICYS